MKILVISQMYPCKRHPTSAIFFANLMKELALKVDCLVVITPRPYIPKILTTIKEKWSKWYLDPMTSTDDRVEIIRPYFLSFRSIRYAAINGILMQLSLFHMIKKLIKEKQIEVILAYNMIPEGIAAVRLAKKFNLPVAFWAIGTDVNDFAGYNKINTYLSKKTIQESNLVIAESKDLENKIRTLTSKNKSIKTFYKGIDISNFRDLPSRDVLLRKLELPSERRYILFVGRLIYDKGIYELAETFNNLVKKYSDLDLILVGEEIEKDALIAKFTAYGILDKIHFKGITPYREIAYYMRISELLLFPTWAEGLPNVVMEAMAIGLPVVASNVDGIPEILENRVTGLSVPPKDSEKLTEAAITMIEDDEIREKCVRNAKKLIYDKFNVKKNVLQLYDLLRKLQANPEKIL